MDFAAHLTWVTAELVTAALGNTHWRDNFNETAPAKATAAGDLFVATGSNAIKRVALGTAYQFPWVNSGATDLEYGSRPFMSAATKTYYIDGSAGDDSDDGLTSGTAWLTWAKAETMIPWICKHQYTIRIIGNLADTVELRGFLGYRTGVVTTVEHPLIIRGDTTTPGSHIVGDVYLTGCTGVQVRYVQVSGGSTGTIFVSTCSHISIDTVEPRAGGGKSAIFVEHSTGVYVQTWDIGTNVSRDGLACSNARVFSNNGTGNATQYGLWAADAGTIGKGSGTQPTGTTSNENASDGGVIR